MDHDISLSRREPLGVTASADERYRPLFALSPQPAWVYDLATLRFLEVNEAAVRSYGWTRDEFLAMTIRDIRPPAALPQLDAMLVGVATRQRYNAASLHRTKAGRVLQVEISSYPLEFDGRAARMVLVHDVTEREAAVRALALSEEKYRSVIEQLRDVFFRTDPAGHWTFLNSAWTTLTGNPVETSLGTHYLSYVHPSDRSVLLDAFRSLWEGQEDSTVVEVRYFHRAGGYRWVEANTHWFATTTARCLVRWARCAMSLNDAPRMRNACGSRRTSDSFSTRRSRAFTVSTRAVSSPS